MPVWLGQAPSGTGWRYMHEDGRVEDIDPVQVGLPPDWRPPGFEGTAPAPDQVSVDPSNLHQQFPPNQELGTTQGHLPMASEVVNGTPAPPSAPRAPQSQATSTRSSFSGSTIPVDQLPNDRMSQDAARSANARASAYDQVFDAQAAAADQEADILSRKADAEAVGRAQQAFDIHNNADAHAREAAAIDAESREWTGRIQQMMNEMPTLDANKIFHDMDSYQSAATGIAAFMGGFLAPVLGTNAPMDIINKAIDRSIMQQQNAQAMQQNKIAQTQSLAANDTEQARWLLHEADISRLGHLTALEREIDAKALGYQSELFKNNASKMKANILKAKFDITEDMFQKDRNHKQAMYIAQTQRAHQSAMFAEAQKQTAAAQAEPAGKTAPEPSQGIVISPISGKKYVIDPDRYGSDPKNPKVTPAQLADHDKAWQANAAVGEAIRELVDASTAEGQIYAGLASGNKWTSSEGKEALKGLHARLKMMIIKKASGLAFSEKEMEATLEQVGSLESWTKVGPKQQLKNMMRFSGTDQTRLGKSLGLTDSETGQPYDGTTEFFLPELEDPKPQGAGSATASVKNYNPSVAGDDTKTAVLADAKWAVDNIDRLTPAQVGELHSSLLAKAEVAPDTGTKTALVNYAKTLEAKLRVLDVTQQGWVQGTDRPDETEDSLFAPRGGNLTPRNVTDSLGRIK